jgi:flagellar biosynthesis protein FlhB
MSEDRTQPPSKRRRQLARQQGQVAHSPELTSAAGWLIAVIVLGVMGDDLMRGMITLVSGSLADPSSSSVDPAGVAAHVRGLVPVLAWPLLVILAAFAAGALAAHQVQVRGLWTPHLIAPDPARLWSFSRGPGVAVQAERTSSALVKSVLLIGVSAWTIRAGWADILRASGLEGPALARVAGGLVLHLARVLATLLVVSGLVDYWLRHRRFESMLRTTPQEQREDRRVIEGDVTARAQRRQLARSWRGDSPELLTGATLVLIGPGGLTLILAGGPPPRRVTVRASAKGNTGLRLRRSAGALKVTQVDAPDLARRLVQHPASGSSLTAELVAELASIWPAL